MKTGSILSKEGQLHYILVKNTQVCLYPFRMQHGRLIVQVSFHCVAFFTIIRQMAPLPSGLSTAMDAIAAN